MLKNILVQQTKLNYYITRSQLIFEKNYGLFEIYLISGKFKNNFELYFL